jgi:hypothetical protein
VLLIYRLNRRGRQINLEPLQGARHGWSIWFIAGTVSGDTKINFESKDIEYIGRIISGIFLQYEKKKKGAIAPQCALASSFMSFLDYTQRRATFGRTPLDA